MRSNRHSFLVEIGAASHHQAFRIPQHLDGHGAVDKALPSFIDNAHAALP